MWSNLSGSQSLKCWGNAIAVSASNASFNETRLCYACSSQLTSKDSYPLLLVSGICTNRFPSPNYQCVLRSKQVVDCINRLQSLSLVLLTLTCVMTHRLGSHGWLVGVLQVQTALGAILREPSARDLPCGVFGSFGWSGEAVDELEGRLTVGRHVLRCSPA